MARGAGPFILSRGRHSFKIHFLYCQSHRKAIIERKLAKKRAGKPVRGQYHAKHADFTQEEFDRRVAWLLRLISDPDSGFNEAMRDAKPATDASRDILGGIGRPLGKSG